MRASRLMTLVGAGTTVLLWTVGPALADSNRTDEGLPLTNRASQTVFELQGIDVANFRVASGGISAVNRLGIVHRRLVRIMETQLQEGDVQVALRNGSWQILLKGHLLFTACDADARANGSTTQGLAETWGSHLREAVKLMAHEQHIEGESKSDAAASVAEDKANN